MFKTIKMDTLAERDIKQQAKAPVNFSWVLPGQLAGMGFPRYDSNMTYLVQCGITKLVTLTGGRPPRVDNHPEIEILRVCVQEFTPPSLQQIEQSIDFIEKAHQTNEAVGVHCMHGIGRTGTLLACYLVKHLNINADDAIRRIRDLRPWSIETEDQEEVVDEYSRHISKTEGEIKQRAKAPINFSWVIPGQLAGMGFPRYDSHMTYLTQCGITKLVTLTGGSPPCVDNHPEIEILHLCVEEFTPPTLQQVKQSIDFIEKAHRSNQAVGVHCTHGIGRTGTILACYLAKRLNIDADDAIRRIRDLRPWSIETDEQEEVVDEYCRHISQKQTIPSTEL